MYNIRNQKEFDFDVIENSPFLSIVKTENGIMRVVESKMFLHLELKTRKGVTPVTGEIRVSRKNGVLHLLVKDGIAETGKRQRYLSYGEGTKVIPRIVLC